MNPLRQAAFDNYQCYYKFKSYLTQYDLKVIANEYNPFEAVENPFGNAPYWILINKIGIKNPHPLYKPGIKKEQKYAKENLVTLSHLKEIEVPETCKDFKLCFIETNNYTRWRRISLEMIPELNVDSRTVSSETLPQFYRRCYEKYGTDHVFKIEFILCPMLEREVQFKHEKHSWKQGEESYLLETKTIKVPDPSKLSDLKKSLIDLCSLIEAAGITNYYVGADVEAIVHIPLYSLPAFRCIVYHPFRYKVYQCSGGNLTRFSGAKFTDVKKAQVLLT